MAFKKLWNKWRSDSDNEDLGGDDRGGIPDLEHPPLDECTPPPPAEPPAGADGPRPPRDADSAGPARRAYQNEINDTAYKERSNQVARIEAMFCDYGSPVCSHILAQTLIPGGISRLVTKLGLTSHHREGADLALLEAWLEKNGAEDFQRAVGIRPRDPRTPPPPRGGPEKEEKEPRIRELGKKDPQTPRPPMHASGGRASKEGTGSPRQQVSVKPVNLSGEEQRKEEERPSPTEPGNQVPDKPSQGFMFSPKKKPGDQNKS